MFRQWFALLLVLLATTSWAEDDARQILERMDEYRLPGQEVRVVTEIQLFKRGKMESNRRYDVYVAPGRKSLALFKSEKEKGQKVLMLQDNFWMILPNSKRPIRITPMQKMLGEASVGDIASLSWSEDYSAIRKGEAELPGIGTSLELELTAARKGLSYSRVEMFVKPENYQPLYARLYLRSGKLAKEAWFEFDETTELISAMRLKDNIQAESETQVRYLSIESVSIPQKYFNPAYLTRNTIQL